MTSSAEMAFLEMRIDFLNPSALVLLALLPSVCFARSAVMGALYDFSLPGLVVFSVLAELAAIPYFVVVARQMPRVRAVS